MTAAEVTTQKPKPINLSDLLESALLGKIVECFLDDGFRVVISDQDGGGLYVYGIADNGEAVPEGGYTHWVRCVPGNGPDFISDYSVNLEQTIKPANDLAAMFE